MPQTSEKSHKLLQKSDKTVKKGKICDKKS